MYNEITQTLRDYAHKENYAADFTKVIIPKRILHQAAEIIENLSYTLKNPTEKSDTKE